MGLRGRAIDRESNIIQFGGNYSFRQIRRNQAAVGIHGGDYPRAGGIIGQFQDIGTQQGLSAGEIKLS